MNIDNSDYYKKNRKRTLEDIQLILEKSKTKKKPEIDDFKNIFKESSDQITDSWKKGRKYSRTIFLQEAFGDQFPDNYLDFSLSIDVMVNILDDFLDENLSSEIKKNYVIEFLRNFSFYNYKETPKEIRDATALYMSKLITLAVSEKSFEENVKKLTNFDKIVDISIDLLKLRSMDIEIFTQIALIDNNDKQKEVIEISKLFRALNIFKKDIIDIPHDKENGMETIVTLVLDKDISFKKYTDRIFDEFIKEAKTLKEGKKNKIIENFYKMMIEDREEVNNILNK
jgi:hypothetical protein